MTFPAPAYRYRARLERLVDGDTVYLRVDLGFRVEISVNVRLEGIDAPERFTEAGKEASAWLSERLAGKDLVLMSTRIEKYGRALGVIYVVGTEGNINDRMVAAGHAVYYDGGARV